VYDLPPYIGATLLAGVIGGMALLSVALYRGAILAGLGRPRAAGVAAAAATLLTGWLVATSLIAESGAYNQRSPLPLTVLVGFGMFITLLAATRIPVVSRVLAAPGTAARLAVPQTVRVVGVVWVLAAISSPLSLMFALPAFLGDTATGAAAPFVARRLARGNGRTEAIWFNAFGLAELVFAVATAVTSTLVIGYQSIEPLRLLPLVLAPTFGVPLAMAMHVVSLRQLLPRRAQEGVLQAGGPA
jgi:hypothetical protein